MDDCNMKIKIRDLKPGTTIMLKWGKSFPIMLANGNEDAEIELIL